MSFINPLASIDPQPKQTKSNNETHLKTHQEAASYLSYSSFDDSRNTTGHAAQYIPTTTHISPAHTNSHTNTNTFRFSLSLPPNPPSPREMRSRRNARHPRTPVPENLPQLASRDIALRTSQSLSEYVVSSGYQEGFMRKVQCPCAGCEEGVLWVGKAEYSDCGCRCEREGGGRCIADSGDCEEEGRVVERDAEARREKAGEGRRDRESEENSRLLTKNLRLPVVNCTEQICDLVTKTSYVLEVAL
ncbi:hypothetical protein DL95DRAFT_504487 [Leptodontidium sp. 2 PMI_412]|nr:hypothetical protein DL95DRAFT_504487 [Leptodontidium sp. 2 PMI_412]